MILSIGIDVVEVDRIERAVVRLGDRFLRRIYTQSELDYCDARGPRAVHLAGRFAAKEAAMKALGTGWGSGVSWREFEILPSGGGAPRLELSGAALERFAQLGATTSHLSISHTRGLAVAQAIFERI